MLKSTFHLARQFARAPRRSLHKTRDHLAAVSAAIENELASPVAEHLPNVVYPNVRLARQDPVLDVLLPGIQLKHMSGGPNTAANLTYRLAQLDVPIRYVSADLDLEPDRDGLWAHLAGLTGLPTRLEGVTLATTYDRAATYELGESDVFFATAWWTAHYATRLLRQSRNDTFIYMIQDFEPGFYNWSSQYALALQTYDMDYRAVICGHLLAEYLSESKVGRFADPCFIDSCAVFEPAIDTTRFYPNPDAPADGPRRLLFYARPEAPRNLFEIGIAALKTAVEQGTFPADLWELWFIGADIGTRDLGRGVAIRQHPWLDYDAYAGLLRGCDVGLSLMLSPHTSYPPLEMAACGASVVTNTFANKDAARLRQYSGNLIPATPNLESITAGLREAAERVQDRGVRLAGSRLQVPSSWDEAFAPVLPALKAMWDDCRQGRFHG
jgi:O-antigen biosynthesis protein